MKEKKENVIKSYENLRKKEKKKAQRVEKKEGRGVGGWGG